MTSNPKKVTLITNFDFQILLLFVEFKLYFDLFTLVLKLTEQFLNYEKLI